jgi:hypothetical protein
MNESNKYWFSGEDLVSLLGKSQESFEVKHFISRLNESPAFFYEIGNYEFMDSGMAFYFSCPFEASRSHTERKLIKIMLFSEGFDRHYGAEVVPFLREYQGYKQYRGSIPGDIKFSDDRQTILKKLGLPSKSGRWWYEWLFTTYSMRVAYEKRDKIFWISLDHVGTDKEKGTRWQKLWKGLGGA